MAGIAASKAMLAAFARSNTKYADIVYVDWNRALAMTAESPASEAYVHACIKLAAASTEIESDSAARWFLTVLTTLYLPAVYLCSPETDNRHSIYYCVARKPQNAAWCSLHQRKQVYAWP